MKITYYGHSCFSIEVGGKHLLFDPFITPNGLAKSIDVNSVPVDYIFISHAHFDHINDALSIAKRTGAMVVSSWEINTWLGNNGVKNTQPLNPGGKTTFDFGEVRSVAAVHSSSFSDGSYGGVAAGFVVKTREGNFYYSGDTALTLDMQLIPKWATIDFAILPVGDHLTMGVEDATIAAGWLGIKHIVGVHYDTFDLIKLDRPWATDICKREGITLHLFEIGSVTDLAAILK